ncbi:MAG: hypothetical protein AAF466_00125 [Bacteroidota bacterium]
MNYLKTLFALTALVALSCCNQKATTDAMAESKKAEMQTKMTTNGFKMGTIVTSKEEGDCAVVIKLEDKDYQYFLDPINLDEGFKTDGEKVWVKFNGLRMANRCVKANPVSIVEIQKREE